MPLEMLTYAELGNRLNCSPEAARALVKRLRLPRQLGSDGKAVVAVDAAELTHRLMPARSPAGHHPVTATLNARVQGLHAMMVKLEAMAAGNRADFERERERADRLMAELLRTTANMAWREPRQSVARAHRPAEPPSRSWWHRMLGRDDQP